MDRLERKTKNFDWIHFMRLTVKKYITLLLWLAWVQKYKDLVKLLTYNKPSKQAHIRRRHHFHVYIRLSVGEKKEMNLSSIVLLLTLQHRFASQTHIYSFQFIFLSSNPLLILSPSRLSARQPRIIQCGDRACFHLQSGARGRQKQLKKYAKKKKWKMEMEREMEIDKRRSEKRAKKGRTERGEWKITSFEFWFSNAAVKEPKRPYHENKLKHFPLNDSNLQSPLIFISYFFYWSTSRLHLPPVGRCHGRQ